MASFGPYRRNVIDPVGLTPPDSVAWSVSTVPTRPPADAVVTRAGAAVVMVALSLAPLQAPGMAALLASPL